MFAHVPSKRKHFVTLCLDTALLVSSHESGAGTYSPPDEYFKMGPANLYGPIYEVIHEGR
jgi:hypothetical protein